MASLAWVEILVNAVVESFSFSSRGGSGDAEDAKMAWRRQKSPLWGVGDDEGRRERNRMDGWTDQQGSKSNFEHWTAITVKKIILTLSTDSCHALKY